MPSLLELSKTDKRIRPTVELQKDTSNTYQNKGIFSRLYEDYKTRKENIGSMVSRAANENTYLGDQGTTGFAKSFATGTGILGQLAGGVADVVGEAAISAGRAVLPYDAESQINDYVNKLGTLAPVQAAHKAWSDFENNNPYTATAVGGAANIASVFGPEELVTGPLSKAGSALVKSGLKEATAVAEKVAPKAVKAIKTSADVGKSVAGSAVGQVMAMSPETVQSIFTGKISKKAMENLDRVSLGERARIGINKAVEDLSGLGSEYETIRNSGAKVNIPIGGRVAKEGNVIREFSKPIVDSLRDFGLSIDENGRILKNIDSKPIDDATRGAIQDFLDTYGQTGDITANQFLNVRKAASDIANYGDTSPDLAESFARTLRSKYDAIGKNDIKGLSELDAKYSPMHSELSALKRDFIGPRGELKDAALSKLANLTNKGREQVLARLEKYVPGITEEIHALKAIDDISSANGLKVASYTRSGIAGGLAVLHPMVGIPLLLASHPAFAVPLLRNFGNVYRGSRKAVESILSKLKTGESLTTTEKTVFSNAIKDAAEYQNKNIDMLGGKRMSSGFTPTDNSPRYMAKLTGGVDAQNANEAKAAITSAKSPDAALMAEVKKYKTAKNLSTEDRMLERAAFDLIDKQKAALLQANKTKHGKIINTDDFRPLFKDIGYRGTNSAAVQEPSSYLANKAFDEALKNPEPFAVFSSGMSGSGKTSALKNIGDFQDVADNAAAILDSNLSSIDSARKKIQKTIDAGKEPRIFYVYRDPVEGFVNGVVKRMKFNQEEMGRIVPTKVIANNAIGSWEVAKKLYNEGVKVKFIDNSLGSGDAVEKSIDAMMGKIKYPSESELTSILNAEAKHLFEQGELTLDQYQKLVE